MPRTHECEHFVKKLHTDPVSLKTVTRGLNWNMGYTARTAF